MTQMQLKTLKKEISRYLKLFFLKGQHKQREGIWSLNHDFRELNLGAIS